MSLDMFKKFEERDFVFRNSKGKAKAAPQLPFGVKVADTHCHLGMLDDIPLALARAGHYGVAFLECITDPSELAPDELSSRQLYAGMEGWLAQAQELLSEWDGSLAKAPRIRMAVGVHPHNAKDWEKGEPILMELLKDPLTSCIGEIGLDYHYDKSPRPVQREVFAKQLQLAHETGLPVALHIREAHDDAAAILREQGCPAAGTILHCFNLDAAALEPFVEMGCHIAFGGPLTFKKEFETRAACLNVPLDRLLTETDAPFMAPEPLRGTMCLPDQTIFTLKMLAECFGYDGADRALELISPRAVDLAEGEEPPAVQAPDFAALQCGQDQTAFCALLYRNAVSLLNRPLTDWQKA